MYVSCRDARLLVVLATVDQVVGANLRTLREAAGSTQDELAARMTVLGTEWTASNVSLMEAGKRKFTLTALADLCRVLEVPLSALLGVPPGIPDTTAARVAALGGTAAATSKARPRLVDDEQSDELVRQRLGLRVLDRIVGAFTWLGDADIDPDFQREEVLDALLSHYGNRDVIALRDSLASQRLDGEDDRGLQAMATSRGWATRDMIDAIWDELADRGMVQRQGTSRIPF